MNKIEVIAAITYAGSEFERVAEGTHSKEFLDGYKRSITDIKALFEQDDAPIAPDYAAERKVLLAALTNAAAENARLEQALQDQQAVNIKLLEEIDLAKMLGVGSHAKRKGIFG